MLISFRKLWKELTLVEYARAHLILIAPKDTVFYLWSLSSQRVNHSVKVTQFVNTRQYRDSNPYLLGSKSYSHPVASYCLLVYFLSRNQSPCGGPFKLEPRSISQREVPGILFSFLAFLWDLEGNLFFGEISLHLTSLLLLYILKTIKRQKSHPKL